MLRVNLSGKPSRLRAFGPWKPLSIGLALLFTVQASLWLQGRIAADRLQKDALSLQAHLQDLEGQARALALSGDLRILAGAVTAFNDWHREKAQSPALILARLEQARPAVCELTQFESVQGNGSLRALVPDTDAAMRWLNAVFPGTTGRVAIEERRAGRLTVAFSWTE